MTSREKASTHDDMDHITYAALPDVGQCSQAFPALPKRQQTRFHFRCSSQGEERSSGSGDRQLR